MSSLLRLSGILRSLRTPQPTHFFSPSHTLTRTNPTRPRLYSKRVNQSSRNRSNDSQVKANNSRNRSYDSQVKANNNVLYALMGTNIAIFGYATYVQQQLKEGYKLPYIHFMENMTLNYSKFKDGVLLPFFISNFAHLKLGHIFQNMITLYFFGRVLTSAPIITPMRFLTIALGSSFSGSIAWLINRYYQLQAQGPGVRDNVHALGFSGVVMGISSVAACVAPQARFFILGIIPIRLWVIVAVYAMSDGLNLNSADTSIGHANHMGGLAFGLVYYFTRLRGLR